MTACEIVGGVFLTRNELFRMEQLPVCARTHFVHYSGLQVDKHTTRNMFSGTSFTEKSVESIVTTTDCFIAWHLPIRLDAMLQAKELPTGIAYLAPCLPQMDTPC